MLGALVEGRCTMSTVIAEVMCRTVSTVSMSDPSEMLTAAFMRGETALVLDEDGALITLLSKLDLIEYLSHGNAPAPA